MAVVYIQLLYQVYILALIVTGTEIEAETISGTPDSLYTDNGSYSCIITCTRISNNFYALNILPNLVDPIPNHHVLAAH